MTAETETRETTEEAPEPQMMKWRELAGAIDRAKTVWVYVQWGPASEDAEGEPIGEDYVQVKKESARAIAERAKETGSLVAAHWDGRDLMIGPCDEEGEAEGADGDDGDDELEDEPDDEGLDDDDDEEPEGGGGPA